MDYELIAPPAAEPVTRDEAKAFLRVAVSDDDALIDALIETARQWCEGWTGRSLVTQGWRLWLDAWSDVVRLDKGPVQAVTAITVYDANNVAAQMNLADVQFDRAQARLTPAQGKGWLPPGRALAGIAIDFTAGYGDAGTDVPPALRHGILMTIAQCYQERETVSAPSGALRFWQPYRQVRL